MSKKYYYISGYNDITGRRHGFLHIGEKEEGLRIINKLFDYTNIKVRHCDKWGN